MPRAEARQLRRAGTERDSAEPGRRSRSRSLGASPEVGQDPSLLPCAELREADTHAEMRTGKVHTAAAENAWQVSGRGRLCFIAS